MMRDPHIRCNVILSATNAAKAIVGHLGTVMPISVIAMKCVIAVDGLLMRINFQLKSKENDGND